MWGVSARAHVNASFARWCLHARSSIADQGVILVPICDIYMCWTVCLPTVVISVCVLTMCLPLFYWLDFAYQWGIALLAITWINININNEKFPKNPHGGSLSLQEQSLSCVRSKHFGFALDSEKLWEPESDCSKHWGKLALWVCDR